MEGNIEKAAFTIAIALFLHGCMTEPRDLDTDKVAEAMMMSNGYKKVCKDSGKWYGRKICEWVKQ